MYRDSLTAAVRRQPNLRYALSIALLLALVFTASIVSAELRFAGSSTAPWWPAAGISVFAVFAARGRGFTVAGLIALVTFAANLIAGTVWWVALAFGIANAVEAWLVPAITGFRRRPGRRFRRGDSVRFLIATGLGAATVGILVGIVVALGGGSLLSTAAHVAVSHGSAVLLIVVLGLLPRSSFALGHRLELAVQVLLLGVAFGLAFGPLENLSLAFLPFPLLAWAAFRFNAGVTLIEFVLVSIAVAVASLLGAGPFTVVAADDSGLLVGLIQIFVLSFAIAFIPVAVAQDDRTDLYFQLRAREQLLRGAIVSAHAGFVIVRRERDDRYRVVESNPHGERLLSAWLTADGDTMLIDGDRIAKLGGTPTSVVLPGEVHLDITVNPVTGDDGLLLIQAIDITEQSEAARALADAFVHEREAADRMRALAAQKNEFVSSVSHELRTPVTSILGYAEELAEADLPESERRGIDVIMRNARRLATLVDDLLNVSSEAGRAESAPTAVELRTAIDECVEELSAIAERARVIVETRSDGDPVISVDRKGLDRVLANLLANAIKFTPPGGRIDITTATLDGFARIEVVDTGRGIPPHEIEKVFERFYRITGYNEFVPGTGLGLPIVRDLVTRMGGQIQLRSDGKTGTTAVVDLPLFVATP